MSNVIEKHIELRAPRSRVWQALTDSAQFGEWFRAVFAAPFVPGDTARATLLYPGYEHLTMEFYIDRIQPEDYFSYRWHPYAVDPAIDYTQETPTLVEFHLTDTPTGTLLRVVESGFDALPDSRREKCVKSNTSGWTQQMAHIEAYVAAQP